MRPRYPPVRAVGAILLLVEAGQDMQPGREPADILDTFAPSHYKKSYKRPGLKAYWRTRENSPATFFDQDRIMGGGSAKYQYPHHHACEKMAAEMGSERNP
jgi:hypothetical protein